MTRKTCDPKSLFAMYSAATNKQAPSASTISNMEKLDNQQRLAYASVDADIHYNDVLDDKKTAMDLLKPRDLFSKVKAADSYSFGYAREYLPKNLWKNIQSLHKTFDSLGSARNRNDYNEVVGAPAGVMRDKIIDAVLSSDGFVGPALREFGLDKRSAAYAIDYLDYIARGGVMYGDPIDNAFQKVFAKGLRNQAASAANHNAVWAIANLDQDIPRTIAEYSFTNPVGTVKGLFELAKDTAREPLGLISGFKDLKKTSLYTHNSADLNLKNPLEVFKASVNIHKNVAFYLEKNTKNRGLDSVNATTFDSEWYDIPPAYRNKWSNNIVFGLAKYAINETRWNLKLMRDVVSNKTTSTQKREAAQVFFGHALYKAAALGSVSIVPSFVWKALPKEMKEEYIYQMEGIGVKEKGPFLLIDDPEYMQSAGGTIGGRLMQLTGTAATFSKAISGIIKSTFVEPNVGAAAAYGLAGASAVANVAMPPSSYNSQLFTKELGVLADWLYNSTGDIDELAQKALNKIKIDTKGGNDD